MVDWAGLWWRARSPERGFHTLALAPPRRGPSLVRLLLLRAPVAFVEGLLTYLASFFVGPAADEADEAEQAGGRLAAA